MAEGEEQEDKEEEDKEKREREKKEPEATGRRKKNDPNDAMNFFISL